MQVKLSHCWPDGSAVDVILDDLIDAFDPLRTTDLTAYARDLLRNVVADTEHRNAEHQAE